MFKYLTKMIRFLALPITVIAAMDASAAEMTPLTPLFDPQRYTETAQPAPDTQKSDFICPALPDMDLYDLKLNSIYDQTDPSRSKIDPYAYNRYHNLRKPIAKFEEKLIRMANAYMLGGSKSVDRPLAACVLSWLEDLAKNEAFLGRRMNKTGRIMRHWVLTTLSAAYAQTAQMPRLTTADETQKQTIEWWLTKLAFAVINDYPHTSPDASNHSNLSYWAAYAVGSTALVLQDRRMFQWAMMRTEKALNDIRNNGTLPKELARQSKALQYHLYALSPLTMLMEMGQRNGYDLYPYNNGAYHKLVYMVLNNMRNPLFLTQITGHIQDTENIAKFGNMAWVEIYAQAYYTPQLYQHLMIYRPYYNRRLGGDITAIWAPYHQHMQKPQTPQSTKH